MIKLISSITTYSFIKYLVCSFLKTLDEMLQVSFDFLKYFNENIISISICVQKVYNLCHLLSIEMLNVRELIIIDTFYPYRSVL